MKILLVKPPSDIHLVIPPIGLAYVAAGCNGHEVTILDCLRDKYDHQDLENYIRREKPDVVGITAFSMEIGSALECSQIVKRVDHNIITLIGGAHVSNVPEDVMGKESVDYIMVGEADRAFPLFLEALQNGLSIEDIPGLGYLSDGRVRVNPPEIIDDLDTVPLPRYDLLRLQDYPRTYQNRRFPVGPIITSRGCPFLCTFCSGHTVSGRKFRARSPEKIVEEIMFLHERYNVKEISIYDDNFTLNKQRTREICELLIAENMGLIWNLPNGLRIDTLDLELLKLMKRAGCYSICIGIESCSDRILKDMKKDLTVATIKEKVPLISKAGIQSTGFFIIGYPTETRIDIMKTVTISRKLRLDRARYFIFQPLPGSESFQELVARKIIDPDLDWNTIDYSKAHLLTPGIEDVTLIQKIQRNAILGFYLRPRIFAKYIWQNMTLDQLKELAFMIKIYILHR